MEYTIGATELARTLGDILARIRYRRDSFVVERNGTPIARVVPIESGGREATLGEALAAWSETSDPSFAEDLARVSASDRAPGNPWAL
jgi:antitoxin (DNA-binding transcriptional repressor) of toxin-antitoxin stability system